MPMTTSRPLRFRILLDIALWVSQVAFVPLASKRWSM